MKVIVQNIKNNEVEFIDDEEWKARRKDHNHPYRSLTVDQLVKAFKTGSAKIKKDEIVIDLPIEQAIKQLFKE